MQKLKKIILSALAIAFVLTPVVANATITSSGNFPTTANYFQDGDVINAGDWNNIENIIGTLSTTSRATILGKLSDIMSTTTMIQLTTLLNLTSVGTLTTGTWNASTINVAYGGTGKTTLTASQLIYGNGTGAVASVATTSVTCGTGTSCTSFTAIGSSPVTITATGSGNVATSTNETAGRIAYWTSNSGTPALLGEVATSSLAVGASLSTSGTLGAQVGGTASSLSINTANTNTWSVLQNFNYSSSTVYSSFQFASSTREDIGTLFLPNLSQGVLYIGSSGKVNSVASSSLNVGTATALAANPTNCSAGNYPLGIDASGNVESCTSAGGTSLLTASTTESAYTYLNTGTFLSAPAILATSTTATSTIANLNGKMWVPWDYNTRGCAGNPATKDFGACVNALYALGASKGILMVPIGVPAMVVPSANWQTAINFGTNGIGASLQCEKGAVLIYGGTATSTLWNGGNPTGHTQSDNYGCIMQGQTSRVAAAQTNSNTTVGIGVGGSNGGVGINFHDWDLNGFGQNIHISSNAYMLSFNNVHSSGGNGGVLGNLLYIDKANNSGERNVFNNMIFTDPGNSIEDNAIYITSGGTASNFFSNISIDDAQVFTGASNGMNSWINVHIENAAHGTYGAYIPFLGVSSDQSTHMVFENIVIANDTSGANSFDTIFKVGGPSMVHGVNLQNYGGGTVSALIDHSLDNGNSGDNVCSISVQGGALTQITAGGGGITWSRSAGSACTYNVDNSYSIGLLPQSNNTNIFVTGNVTAGSYDHSGNWSLGVDAVPSTVTINKNLIVDTSIALATSTLNYPFEVFSSSNSQMALSAGAGIAKWAFRNAGGNFYLGTTTVAGTATSSVAAFSIAGSGFGTTTVIGLNISGQATSTSNVGFNITTGCYAIAGTCVGGGAGGVTSVTGTYPVISSGGTTPAISLAFGTTTNNIWAGLQTFTYSTTTYASFTTASTTNFTIASSTYTSFGGIINPMRKGNTEDRYYGAMSNGVALTNVTPVSGTMYALPMIVSRGMYVNASKFSNEGTGASSHARTGIYSDDGNMYPNALMVDCGEVDTSSGLGTKTSTCTSTFLSPGLYWIVWHNDGTSPVIRGYPNAALLPLLGEPATIATAQGVAWSVTAAYGALPSTFPGGAAVINTTPFPAVFFRSN